MSNTKKTFISVVLALIVALTCLASLGIGADSRKVQAESAWTEGEFIRTNEISLEETYYFTDSCATFMEVLEDEKYSSTETFYDFHGFMTNQELAFLLYSGYFWGFGETTVKVVIIELNTFVPQQSILQELFECLKQQGVAVMYISYYLEESGYTVGQVEDYLWCIPNNGDKYSEFFDNSIKYMGDPDMANTLDNSTIFIDGRLIELYNIQTEYNLLDCWSSSHLRRIFNDIVYGGVDDQTEEAIYNALWKHLMADSYFNPYELTLDYFNGDTSINEYIDMWTDTQIKHQEDNISYDDFQLFKEDANSIYKDAIGLYYEPVVEDITSRGIHIFAHINENEYIDVTTFYKPNENSFNAQIYNFSTYAEFCNSVDASVINVKNLYAMAQYALNHDFYAFLANLQYIQMHDNSLKLDIFVLEKDPIIWSDDGLSVMPDSDLQSMYEIKSIYEPAQLEAWFKESFVDALAYASDKS